VQRRSSVFCGEKDEEPPPPLEGKMTDEGDATGLQPARMGWA
jgi:hypothetical protein